jgi:hypothetical protein
MIQEVKRKFSDIGKRKPIYLGDYEYDLISEYYSKIFEYITKTLSNISLTDKQIDMVIERCDNSFSHIRRLVGDKIAILVLIDITDFINEIIEDCVDLELYECAHNLKRINDFINEGYE